MTEIQKPRLANSIIFIFVYQLFGLLISIRYIPQTVMHASPVSNILMFATLITSAAMLASIWKFPKHAWKVALTFCSTNLIQLIYTAINLEDVVKIAKLSLDSTPQASKDPNVMKIASIAMYFGIYSSLFFGLIYISFVAFIFFKRKENLYKALTAYKPPGSSNWPKIIAITAAAIFGLIIVVSFAVGVVTALATKIK